MNPFNQNSLFGIRLDSTHGRSKYGNGQQYYIFAPEWFISYLRPYREWRFGFHAYDYAEAIAMARSDRRVENLHKQMWESEFRRLIADG